VNPMIADLWPDVASLIRANREAARRALCEGDKSRALRHETAAAILEQGRH
jgi:hypothetical protein